MAVGRKSRCSQATRDLLLATERERRRRSPALRDLEANMMASC